MSKSKNIDFPLFFVTILLTAIGVMMVFSSSFYKAIVEFNDKTHFLYKNVQWACIGLLAMLVTTQVKYTVYKKLAPILMLIGLGLLVLVLTPAGATLNNAQRWLRVGSQTFMPSEIAKITLIFFMANSLSRSRGDLKYFVKGLLPFMFVILIHAGLILLQPDLSTAFILVGIGFTMLFVAGMKFSHLIVMAISGAGVLYIAIASSVYRTKRVLAFLNPFEYSFGIGMQVSLSLYAFGQGGLTGEGLGMGTFKYYIPEPQNDFILATIGEEFGFIGICVMMMMFLVLIWRGIRVAMRAPDVFSSLVTSGIIGMIAIQVILNLAVATSSVPPTGIPLPLVSYGGSALVIMMAAIGIVLNISKYCIET